MTITQNPDYNPDYDAWEDNELSRADAWQLEHDPDPKGLGNAVPEPATLSKRLPAYPRLAARIAAAGLTLNDIARGIGYDPNSLSRVLNGFTNPGATLRRRLAELFDESELTLFDPLDKASVATRERLRALMDNPPTTRVVTRAGSVDELLEVAVIYRAASGNRVQRTDAVAEHFKISRSAAYARLRRCRDRGLLCEDE